MQISTLGPEVLDQLYDGLYLVDTERRIQFWNRSAERIAGYSRGEILGRCCHDDLLRHVDDGGRRLCHDGCPLLATIGDGEPREAHVYLQHRDGHRMPVEIRVAPLRDERGEIVGAVEVFNDAGRWHAERRRLEELEREASLDALTQLANRRRFDRVLAGRLEALRQEGSPFGLLLADIDHFKRFNDRWGHPLGDALLRQVARTLQLAVRAEDVVCRYGGEEFAVVVPLESASTLVVLGERLRRLVASLDLPTPVREERVTISLGATIASPEDDAEGLVSRADRALYQSKESGRNRLTTLA